MTIEGIKNPKGLQDPWDLSMDEFFIYEKPLSPLGLVPS
jgi:hypothetical protein